MTCAGSYKVSAFFLAKTVTTAPVEVVQVFLFAVIVYFMTGYQARPTVLQGLSFDVCGHGQ